MSIPSPRVSQVRFTVRWPSARSHAPTMVLLLEPGDPQTSAEMTEVLGWGSALSRRVARCRPPPLALLAQLEHRFRKPLLYPAELRGRGRRYSIRCLYRLLL